MELTKEYLESQHQACISKREEAKAMVLLHDGAAQAFERMIARLDDAVTMEELSEAIVGEPAGL